jgi:hypothetical protein
VRGTAALLITLVVMPALAGPGEVQNLRWTSQTQMTWDTVTGAAAYHLYGGDLVGMPDNATCLVGNNKSESLGSNETVGVDEARFYLVAALDESGEGPLGNDSARRRVVRSRLCRTATRATASSTVITRYATRAC